MKKQKTLKQVIESLAEDIRLAPNRDDKIAGRKLMLSDMGGIGKQEVFELILKHFGEKNHTHNGKNKILHKKRN